MIEKYRDNESEVNFPMACEESHYSEEHSFYQKIWRDGFDTAIALNLPIKFAQWFESSEESYRNWQRRERLKGTYFGRAAKCEIAYKYWAENILKLE